MMGGNYTQRHYMQQLPRNTNKQITTHLLRRTGPPKTPENMKYRNTFTLQEHPSFRHPRHL